MLPVESLLSQQTNFSTTNQCLVYKRCSRKKYRNTGVGGGRRHSLALTKQLYAICSISSLLSRAICRKSSFMENQLFCYKSVFNGTDQSCKINKPNPNCLGQSKIRPRMYARRSIMYENAAFCSLEESSSVARQSVPLKFDKQYFLLSFIKVQMTKIYISVSSLQL